MNSDLTIYLAITAAAILAAAIDVITGVVCYYKGMMKTSNKIHKDNEQLRKDYNNLSSSFETLEKEYEKKFIELDKMKMDINKRNPFEKKYLNNYEAKAMVMD